jgi:threonine dehydratase
MVGGHAPAVCEGMHELLYRFEFPSPGALMNFLTQMSAGWNISLFHYRNHGADYGRAGRHAGAAGRHGRIQEFLQKLGYAHWDESQNRPTSCSSADPASIARCERVKYRF